MDENTMIELFNNANFYWGVALYFINLLIIQPFTPSRIEIKNYDSNFIKALKYGYNIIMKPLKLMAGNFKNAKNFDDVLKKRK